jgi:anaerobic magnesium-protoporphyrin IX monomethyl ester cyclase
MINLVTTPIIDKANRVPPLGIAQLASVLRHAGYKTECFDFNSYEFDTLKEFPHKLLVSNPESIGANVFVNSYAQILDNWVECLLSNHPHVIGLSVIYRSMIIPSLALAMEIKKSAPDVTIIMGGSVGAPSNITMIERLLRTASIDIIASGYGESIILEILEVLLKKMPLSSVNGIYYLEEGNLCSNPTKKYINPSTIPHPDFENLVNEKPMDLWLGFPIQGSRGCINSCTFCNALNNQNFQQRFADHIYSEILNDFYKYNAKHIAFTDSSINGDPNTLKTLCLKLIKVDLNINFFGNLAIMPSVDEEMLDLMKEAGFDKVTLALESPSPKIRKDMHKWNDMRGVNKLIRSCVEREIKPLIHLMHSFPTESEDDFKQLLHFVDDWRPNDFGIVLAWPFRLAEVKIGTIDKWFVNRFNIEIMEGKGIDVPHYWNVFGEEPRWKTIHVNEEIRLQRQVQVEEHLKSWYS